MSVECNHKIKYEIIKPYTYMYRNKDDYAQAKLFEILSKIYGKQKAEKEKKHEWTNGRNEL